MDQRLMFDLPPAVPADDDLAATAAGAPPDAPLAMPKQRLDLPAPAGWLRAALRRLAPTGAGREVR